MGAIPPLAPRVLFVTPDQKLDAERLLDAVRGEPTPVGPGVVTSARMTAEFGKPITTEITWQNTTDVAIAEMQKQLTRIQADNDRLRREARVGTTSCDPSASLVEPCDTTDSDAYWTEREWDAYRTEYQRVAKLAKRQSVAHRLYQISGFVAFVGFYVALYWYAR